MSKKVHIIGAGGPAGIGMTRCLKDHYKVTGEDYSQWAQLMMECEKSSAEEKDLIIGVPDSVVLQSNFRPSEEQIKLCQDKAKTAELLGDLAPRIYWIRDTYGSGGKGAQMASEFLPGPNYSVELVYFHGKLLAEFQKQRISYSVKSKTYGVENRGSSAVSICTAHWGIKMVVDQALKKLPGELHGFYGVDLMCNEDGRALITEINAGRLLTASYAFFHQTGYDLPLVGVRSFFGEELPVLPDYPEGWGQIRQVGQLPKLIPPEITKTWK